MEAHRPVVAITGGGSGIGRATALALARRGARLCLGDVAVPAAEAVAQECLAAGAEGAVAVHVDVCSEAAFSDFLDAAEAALGSVDVLVNNAGVLWVGPFEDEPADWIERQIRVNLIGAINGTRQAARRMKSRTPRPKPPRLRGYMSPPPRLRGHIVTVASAASLLAPAGEATYTATKHGIYGYLKSVRRELRRSGIALSVVMPAVVDTPLAAGTSAGGTSLLTPERIADAIVDVIRRPRFEVVVPRTAAVLHAVQRFCPQFVRDALDSMLVPNQINSADLSKRAEYEKASKPA